MKKYLFIAACLSFAASAEERVYLDSLVKLTEKQTHAMERSIIETDDTDKNNIRMVRNTGVVVGVASTAGMLIAKNKDTGRPLRNISVAGVATAGVAQWSLSKNHKPIVIDEEVIESKITADDLVMHFNDPLMKMMGDVLDTNFGGEDQNTYALFDIQFVGSIIPENLLNSLVANVSADMDPDENFYYVCMEAFDSLNDEINHRMKDRERLTLMHKKFADLYLNRIEAKKVFIEKCKKSFSESLTKKESFVIEKGLNTIQDDLNLGHRLGATD